MAADPNAVITTLPRAGVQSPAQYRAEWHTPLNANWLLLDTYAGFLNVASTWSATQTFGTLNATLVTTSDVNTDNLFLSGAGSSGISFDAGTNTITNLKTGSGTLTYGSIGGGAQETQSVAVTGADTTFIVIATPGGSIGSGFVWNARITSTGICGVTVSNITGAPATPSAVTWRVIALEKA